MNFISKNYHGEVFEGNTCRSLLKNPDILLSSNILKNVSPLVVTPFVFAFKAMDCVVQTCFSEKRVDRVLLKTEIANLKTAFEATELHGTLKIHVLLNHTEDCIRFLNGDGLGTWSEQAGESIHREFIKYWNKYKINLLEHPDYGEHLKKAVVDFSSNNL